MNRLSLLTCLLVLSCICMTASGVETESVFSDTDWPWWRGPGRNGHAAVGQKLPSDWSKTKNVAWKAPIDGRGHSSPSVVGKQIFLSTADETKGVQYVVCFDRDTGRRLWQTTVHRGGLMIKNKKASAASSTVACDGTRLFVNFANADALYTTSLDLSGKILWQTKISSYVMHQGYGGSPAVFGPLVIVSADNKGGGVIAGLRRDTGETVWKRDRPKKPNYASPVILEINGKHQLVLTGCDLVSSFDPLTGDTLWEVDGATTECVTSTITDGKHVYTSGGYPKNHVSAIVADGSGKVAWESKTRVYVPSMLIKGSYIYAVMDAGVAVCWNSASGAEMWKHRLGGTFSSSPVLADDKIFATNEEGETFIFLAQPDEFQLAATVKLGDEVFATPTIVGDRIYMRVVETSGAKRQEMLYCLASE